MAEWGIHPIRLILSPSLKDFSLFVELSFVLSPANYVNFSFLSWIEAVLSSLAGAGIAQYGIN